MATLVDLSRDESERMLATVCLLSSGNCGHEDEAGGFSRAPSRDLALCLRRESSRKPVWRRKTLAGREFARHGSCAASVKSSARFAAVRVSTCGMGRLAVQKRPRAVYGRCVA
jgi:hypothetical protein